MVNNKIPASTYMLASQLRTGWREPPRAFDSLLKQPKGQPLKPREELREVVPAGAVVAVDALPADEKAVRDTGKLLVSSLGGVAEQTVEYDGDVEQESVRQKTAIKTFRVGVDGVVRTSEVAAQAGLDDDELLGGEERDNEDDQLAVAVGEATGPYTSRTCIHTAKTLREGSESIRPHPTDAAKVIFTYRYTDSAGGEFIQETEMPEVMRPPAHASDEPGSIIVPDVGASKVPRAKKGSPWTPVHGTSRHEWSRGDGEQQETWRVVIFFRRLNRDTHVYQDIYFNTSMLHNIDPNDKRFRTWYNKWILQFARRRDARYTQKVARVHWSVSERRALYTAINTFCAKFGVHRFGFTDNCKLSTAQLQLMVDTVNAAPNPLRVAPRSVDAVRGQIMTAHDKAQPKNKAVFDLMVRAVALRARVARGEVVSRAERKPRLAIPLAEFPVDAPVAAAAAPSTSRRKCKRAAPVDSDEEPSSSEPSSPPASPVSGADEETQSEEGERSWSDSSELLSGEDKGGWVVEEDMRSSPPTKKARTSQRNSK